MSSLTFSNEDPLRDPTPGTDRYSFKKTCALTFSTGDPLGDPTPGTDLYSFRYMFLNIWYWRSIRGYYPWNRSLFLQIHVPQYSVLEIH
jgi:hypothetical protein